MPGKVPLWTKDFTLVCVAQLAVSVCFMGTSTVLPMFMEAQLGVTGLLMGLTVASYSITTVLFRPFVGYFLDHWGRRVIYLPSYFLFALLFIFYPLVGTLAAMILVRLLHGLVWGSSLGAAGTIVVDLIPRERRGEGLGIYGLTASFGMALGPAIGVLVIDEFSYRALFTGSGIFLMLFFLVSMAIRVPPVPKSHRPFSFKTLVEKSALPMATVLMIFAIPYGGLVTYTAKYAASGEVSASAGIFFVCLALGMALCRVLAGKSFDRHGPVRVMAYCFLFAVVGYLMLALTRSEILFYLAAFVLGLGYGIAFPVCAAMINHLAAADRRGAANATLWTVFDIGICIGIVLIGFAQEEFGWKNTQLSQAAVLLIALGLFWLYSIKHYFRKVHTPAPDIKHLHCEKLKHYT